MCLWGGVNCHRLKRTVLLWRTRIKAAGRYRGFLLKEKRKKKKKFKKSWGVNKRVRRCLKRGESGHCKREMCFWAEWSDRPGERQNNSMKANDTIDSYQMYSSIRLDVNTAETTSWCIYNPWTFWVYPLPNSSDFPSLNYFSLQSISL